MSTRLKSSRGDTSLTRLKGRDKKTYIQVCMPFNRYYSTIGLNTIDEKISLTREQAGELAQDLLAFANEMEVAQTFQEYEIERDKEYEIERQNLLKK